MSPIPLEVFTDKLKQMYDITFSWVTLLYNVMYNKVINFSLNIVHFKVLLTDYL